MNHRLGIVVVAQRLVRRQASSGALPATIHSDEVDIDVHKQVAFGGPLIDLNIFTVRSRAEVRQVLGIFGIVLI